MAYHNYSVNHYVARLFYIKTILVHVFSILVHVFSILSSSGFPFVGVSLV